MTELLYLDTNFFVYLLTQETENLEKIKKKLNAQKVYTSCLTYDEFVWAVRKLLGKEISIKSAEFILNLEFLHFVDLNKIILSISKEIIENLDLKPRDSLHYATLQVMNIKNLISDDRDFSKLKNDIKTINVENFIKNL
ncbi:MAG TPA: PIN domain-containing protein [Candidatus Nanoarchaeia archaeon]|nr:PIN domain-containing protein [Candidatus Nanoarchaeia archaeon]